MNEWLFDLLRKLAIQPPQPISPDLLEEMRRRGIALPPQLRNLPGFSWKPGAPGVTGSDAMRGPYDTSVSGVNAMPGNGVPNAVGGGGASVDPYEAYRAPEVLTPEQQFAKEHPPYVPKPHIPKPINY